MRDVTLLAEMLRRRAAVDRSASRNAAASVLEAVEQHRALTREELDKVLSLLARALATGAPQRTRLGRDGELALKLDPAPSVVSLLVAEHGAVEVPGVRLTLVAGVGT